jgi:hypothetical protein
VHCTVSTSVYMIENSVAVSQTAVYIQLSYGTFCVCTTKYQNATYQTSAPSHYIAYHFYQYCLDCGTSLCLRYCILCNQLQQNIYFIQTNSCTLSKTHSHSHLKHKLLKMFVKTSLNLYMFRSQLFDHLQGSVFRT